MNFLISLFLLFRKKILFFIISPYFDPKIWPISLVFIWSVDDEKKNHKEKMTFFFLFLISLTYYRYNITHHNEKKTTQKNLCVWSKLKIFHFFFDWFGWTNGDRTKACHHHWSFPHNELIINRSKWNESNMMIDDKKRGNIHTMLCVFFDD